MANVFLYKVSKGNDDGWVSWTACEGYIPPAQLLNERLKTIIFAAREGTISSPPGSTIEQIGTVDSKCIATITPTSTTTTTSTSTTSTTTIVLPQTFSLGYDVSSKYAACDDYLISPTTYYARPGTNFNNTAQLYTDSALTNYAPNGYYSNGFSYGYVNYNGILNDLGICADLITSTSTSTTSTSTTSTSTSTTSTTTAALQCSYNGGSAVITYATTTTTSTSTSTTTSTTTGAPTTTSTSTSTSTTSTTTSTTAAPTSTTTSTSTSTSTTTSTTAGSTTTTTSTTFAPGGENFYVSNVDGTGSITEVNTTGGFEFVVVGTGSYPLFAGQNLSGTAGALTSQPINVGIFNPTTSGCIVLEINNTIIDSIGVSGGGTYTFSNVTFASTDIVQVSYYNGTCP